MAQVDQIQIGTTTYDILQSSDATFTGTSNDSTDSSATSWTEVEKLASSETNGSIFTKISSMFKNIRYLYSKIGNIDIGDVGTSIGDAIKNLSENKADINHTHDTSTMKASDGTPLISTSQVADNNHVPSSLLVKTMNDTLTIINNSYVNKVGITNNSTITLYHNNTSVSSATLTTATSAAVGLLPKLANTTAKCLLGNGTWGTVGSTYATVTTAAAGLAPKLSGTATQYLNGTGRWTVPDNTTYSTFTSAANGLVPAAKSGSTNYATSGYVLTGAGWKAGTKYNTDTTYPVFTGATTAAAGSAGLVKAPTVEERLRFLRGDARWATPTDTTYGTNVGCYGTLEGTTLTLNARSFRV